MHRRRCSSHFVKIFGSAANAGGLGVYVGDRRPTCIVVIVWCRLHGAGIDHVGKLLTVVCTVYHEGRHFTSVRVRLSHHEGSSGLVILGLVSSLVSLFIGEKCGTTICMAADEQIR